MGGGGEEAKHHFANLSVVLTENGLFPFLEFWEGGGG